MAKKPVRQPPLPRTTDEVKASREQPLAPGVFLVRMDKIITGLHVHPGGVAFLYNPDHLWEPQAPVAKVKRAPIIRSRVKITFTDGTKAKVRPYKPQLKGLLDVGQSDSFGNLFLGTTTTDGRSNDLDGFIAAIVLVVGVILFPIALFFLGREMLGTSARAQQAKLLVDQLKAVEAPSGKSI